MTEQNKLIVRGVYSTIYDDRPHRVIGFDEIELFYDCWWELSNDWGLNSTNGKYFFYRTSLKTFKEVSKLLKLAPLNDNEISKYKLHLPYRICRHQGINWTTQVYKSIDDFKESIKHTDFLSNNTGILKTSQIKLYPYGPKGGHKKSIIVYPDNGDFFTEIELLWKAHNIHSAYIKEIKSGVGIFRLGIENGMASYYIGNFYDAAGFTKE